MSNKSVLVNIRMSEQERTKAKKLAENQNTTISEIVRKMFDVLYKHSNANEVRA